MKSYPEPWPRQYARQIAAMRALEDRRVALLNVPEELRELVKTHVQNGWNHPKGVKVDGQQTD